MVETQLCKLRGTFDRLCIPGERRNMYLGAGANILKNGKLPKKGIHVHIKPKKGTY